MSSLWFLYISPVMWAISGLLSLLTVYDDVFFAEETFAISLSVPRIAALAAGLPLVGADFSSVSFLFTGLFAVCAALKTVLTSNEA